MYFLRKFQEVKSGSTESMSEKQQRRQRNSSSETNGRDAVR